MVQLVLPTVYNSPIYPSILHGKNANGSLNTILLGYCKSFEGEIVTHLLTYFLNLQYLQMAEIQINKERWSYFF